MGYPVWFVIQYINTYFQVKYIFSLSYDNLYYVFFTEGATFCFTLFSQESSAFCDLSLEWMYTLLKYVQAKTFASRSKWISYKWMGELVSEWVREKMTYRDATHHEIFIVQKTFFTFALNSNIFFTNFFINA